MATQRFVQYRVTGTGRFPLDMLRHDRAYPHTELDSATATSVGPRSVVVEGRVPPTLVRWASFGWSVSDVREV